jgi:RNA recognition motif-containing protein
VNELRDLCAEHVDVRYVNLPKDRESGKLKGFAFIDVGSEDDIPKLVDALTEAELGGRPLRVSRSLAKDQIRSTRQSGRFVCCTRL